MRSFIACIYLIKAAELDIIRKTAGNLLCGLKFKTAYTPQFAMCADNLSEIIMVTGSEPGETKSVMRFCCSGLYPRQELKAIRMRMDELCKRTHETVGFWCDNDPDYFEKAASKAHHALQRTFKELSRCPGDSFNILIINNDMLPLFELVATKDYNHLEIARPGEVIQFRYEVVIGFRNIMNWKLVHAYKYR